MRRLTERSPDQSAEWSSAPEVVEKPHADEPQAAADSAAIKAARERRSSWQKVGLVLLATGATGAVVAVLIIINPAVEASIESKVPTGTLDLIGNVSSKPVLVTLGVLELGWNPFGPQRAHPIKAQSILLEMHLSLTGCERLAQIGGVCGAGPAPPLRRLESLRVATDGQSLHASVAASAASRSELEPIEEAAHRGAPFDWSLRSYSPSLAVQLSCEHRVAVEVTAPSDRPGTAQRSRTATCNPGGVSYRVRLIDKGPTVTNVGFHRVLRFESSATASRGALTVGHGTLSVDGNSSQVDGGKKVSLSSEPGSMVKSQVVSPVGDTPVEVALRTPQASRTLVDGDERTPDEFERISEGLRNGILITLAGAFIGSLARLIYKLRPWRRNDAKEE